MKDILYDTVLLVCLIFFFEYYKTLNTWISILIGVLLSFFFLVRTFTGREYL